ncbi:MAG: putative Ig domain-containing protein, partial [Blastocatellales bacterium]
LALQVSAGWRAVASDDGKLVTLRGPNDQAIEYGKLVVRDNLGRNIPARLTVAEEQVVIEVEDHSAEYPLTIDPLFTLQQKLLAADGAAGDYLGYSVALDGDTALVGAPYDDENGMEQGSAYVFVRNGAVWTQQARLVAQDRSSFDYFGYSVALKGDTALVGAILGPGSLHPEQGAVYVFVRGGTTWSLQKKLTANENTQGAQFGAALALDGDTAIIGAPAYTITPSYAEIGAVYVFTRSGANWTQQARLNANDGEDGDAFGRAVALDGDTALIGAPNNAVTVGGQGAAYVFTRSGASWTQRQRLTANGALDDHFGNAVALSGEKALIGAYLANFVTGTADDCGAVYDFRRGATGWEQASRFSAPNPTPGARFGVSLALDGDTAVVGASLGLFQTGPNAVDQRSAYVFLQLGDYELVGQFGLGLGSANDSFGYAVALDGDTVLVGAYRSDASATDQGAAYAFTLHDSRHVEQPKLIANDGARNDQFGWSVAVSGNTVAVGVPEDDIGVNSDQGSVYVFTRPSPGPNASWTFQQKLSANDGEAGDRFGWAVALDGDTLVAGAYADDFGAANGQGSAYVFTRNGALWGARQKLSASDGAAGDNFGWAVALNGDTVAVGAQSDDMGRGSIYVFTGGGAAWTFQQKLSASDGEAFDNFGHAVALSGDTVAVGASADDINANADQGSVYVFTRSGGAWTFQQKLTAANGLTRDYFGRAVALDGDTLAAGAPAVSDEAFFTDRPGSVYVFARSGAAWTQRQRITPLDGQGNDSFGWSVALSGGTLAAGGWSATENSTQGRAYVFTRLAGWLQQQKLTPRNRRSDDYLGWSIAVSGDTVVVGASNDPIGANDDQGSAYIFVSPACPALTLDPASLPNGRVGAAYDQTITLNGASVPSENLITVSAGALPPGLRLEKQNDSFGLLRGAPTAAGMYRFTITITHILSGCRASRSYTLTITPPCSAITVNPVGLPAALQGRAFNQTLTATGGAAPYSFAVTAGALPPGMSLSAGGSLSGAPAQPGSFPFTVTATDANGCAGMRAYTLAVSGAVAHASAASYDTGALAPDLIVAAFGANLATETRVATSLPLPTELAGASVTIRDSQGASIRAPLFFVSPNQINYLMPPGLANGVATVTVINGNGVAVESLTEIKAVAPGLFSANASGSGAAAAVALRIRANGQQVYEPVARYDAQTQKFVLLPIDLSNSAEQVYLILFGTGIRHHGSLEDVMIEIGGTQLPVAYAGAASGLAGVDQVNVLAPASLRGRGEQTITLRVSEEASNGVNLRFQ